MQPLVSVIVPIYKAEDVLIRCLDSLRLQSLTNIEILLIDDASPDKCGDICDKYVECDARFRVFHNKTNQGLSISRNIGIENSVSEYLMFVDSDDYVHKDFCKEAYECAIQYQADLVMFDRREFGYSRFFESKRIVNSSLTSGYKTQMEAIDLLLNEIGSAAWNKLYRKKLFKNISYPPGYLYEEIATTYKIVCVASRIYCLNKKLYYRCYHEGSITTQKTEKHLHDWINNYLQQYHDLKAWGYPLDKLHELLLKIAIGYCVMKRPDTSDKNYVFCAKVLSISKSMPVYFSWEKKVMFFLFKYCKPLFELLCDLFNKKIC